MAFWKQYPSQNLEDKWELLSRKEIRNGKSREIYSGKNNMCKVKNVGREWSAVQSDWIRDVKRGVSRNKRQVGLRHEGLC